MQANQKHAEKNKPAKKHQHESKNKLQIRSYVEE